VSLVGEAGDVADLDQQPRGAGGADAVQVGQGGAAVAQQRCELLVRGLLADVEAFEVGHELGGDTLPGLGHDLARADAGQELSGLGSGQVSLGAARDQFQQKGMQLVDLVGVLLPDGATPVDQNPQHLALGVGQDRAQPGHPRSDQGH
jgi:hypothetical protein